MVDTYALGAYAARREGSSPFIRTKVIRSARAGLFALLTTIHMNLRYFCMDLLSAQLRVSKSHPYLLLNSETSTRRISLLAEKELVDGCAIALGALVTYL